MVELPALPDEVRGTLPPVAVAYIAALEAAVATLAARVADLEARLGQNSTNSSRPPSSDPPGTRPPPPAAGSRRPGGQRGHRGRFRRLRPVEAVDRVVLALPPACAQCASALPATAAPADPADLRHQVVDLPPVQAQVTEYRLAARHWPAWGRLTRAAWPADAPHGVVGARLAAAGALLTGRYRLSKREAAPCLADLFGADLAVGTVSAIEQTVSVALAPVVAEARGRCRQRRWRTWTRRAGGKAAGGPGCGRW
ncbi:MAG: DUF6444 domain-containing protein [Firmicutes bacterium]|nr:DUF6444 domain-containing protein [Bacillota bacterium]